MDLATLDFWYLLREWQTLIGGRIQKIYMKDRILVLQIYSKQNYTLLCRDNQAFFTSAKIQFPSEPHGFTMFLRKRIQGGRIKNIELAGFDRIIRITVSTKEATYELIIELFGKVNYMLLSEGKIVSIFATHSYTDRTIRGGVQYQPPPGRPAPWDAPLQGMLGKEAAKTIAVELGVGGKYAEEICARSTIERKAALSDVHLLQLQQTLQELRDIALQPQENGSEALPFPFRTKPGEWRETPTFNASIDAVEASHLETAEIQQHVQEKKQRQTKQEKIIAAQQKQVVQLTQFAAENQQKGELIYEHYGELQQLLEELRSDWKKLTPAQIQEKYKAHRLIRHIGKDGSIEVELESQNV
jgi:predicted ribosome quality control (RQC) complex YloA/Tae2 family protein